MDLLGDWTGAIECDYPCLLEQIVSTRALAYSTQFDRTVNVLSGCLGSFVGKCTLKLCLPPISPCIINCIDSVVF